MNTGKVGQIRRRAHRGHERQMRKEGEANKNMRKIKRKMVKEEEREDKKREKES